MRRIPKRLQGRVPKVYPRATCPSNHEVWQYKSIAKKIIPSLLFFLQTYYVVFCSRFLLEELFSGGVRMQNQFVYKEPVDHINNLFCLHLFIFLPLKTKKRLLKTYLFSFKVFKSKSICILLDVYIKNLLKFHKSILSNDPFMKDQLIEMRALVREIHIELYYELEHCDKKIFIVGNDIIDYVELRNFQKDLRIIHC